MQRNDIFKSYGTDFKEMTKHLLCCADLSNDILEKIKEKSLSKSQIKIGIKPNLGVITPADFGATTHPEIVAGIIEYLQENGFSNISIIEGSWIGDKTSDAFNYCGYNALAEKYSVTLIDGQKQPSISMPYKDFVLNVIKCANDIDFLINVPVLKGHCQTKITCALKNMKGLLPNSEKRRFHTLGLHMPIAYLNACLHQDFIVVDHICGDPNFEEGGEPLIRNCIMAAKDPVLVDSYAATLLGYAPYDIEYIKLAEEFEVGSSNLNDAVITTIRGDEFEECPETHKILDVNYAVCETDSCSACYSVLIGALNRLKDEGLLKKTDFKISIGQGFQGKCGKIGVGNCTKQFEISVPGCPPSENDIYITLKNVLK